MYSGWDEVREAMGRFPWGWAPVLLALAFTNYVLRFFKWDYYLRRIGASVPKGDSFIVFLSGLTMAISPGKIGELLKSVFLRQVSGVPLARSMPIVVAERLTDFVALVIISFLGIGFLAGGDSAMLFAVAGVLAAFILSVSNRRVSLFVISLLERAPLVGRLGHRLHTAYESMASLLAPRPLFAATALSVAAWMCECAGMYLVVRLFDGGATLPAASFVYAFGTIVGAVAPGGLGLTDGTLVAMLQNDAVMSGAPLARGVAGTATMIIRMATLWFAVLVGGIVLLAFQKRFAGAESMLDAGEASYQKSGRGR
ncbi:MAG: flippase-like domain-containing protein [Deltaproteobacteria bacterium]|nr:flippase-like domain-containing protein [Deltaproteobacteria bacterium]